MKTIKSIDMRFECNINTDWTLHYEDGSSDEVYEIDGESPRFSSNDDRVRDVSQELHDFLWSLIFSINDKLEIEGYVTEITGLSSKGEFLPNTKVEREKL